jgi:molybdenum cofactor guanylyltransferase
MILSRVDIRYHHLMSGPPWVAASVGTGTEPGIAAKKSDAAKKSFSGYVLAGGRSTRMGRDKALLPFADSTLIQHVAQCVLSAAGNVTIIGPPDRYCSLGHPVAADLVDNCGPLGGLYTALSITESDWNLIVACDMPRLTAHFLESLLSAVKASAAESSPVDCVVPRIHGIGAGLDPLCAVYHRRCLPAAKAALDLKMLKMHDFISTLEASIWPVADCAPLENVNTPEDWTGRPRPLDHPQNHQ